LGYHPYFHILDTNGGNIGGHILQANVKEVWQTEQNLPTGMRTEVDGEIDFRIPKPLDAIALDHVFTAVQAAPALTSGMVELATLSHPNSCGRLQLLAESAFRDLVLFTPPHRQAIAIEPYTCSADAANIAARDVDSGWRILAPSGRWNALVEYCWLTKR
jgi:aldose 1-epimerase